MKTSLNKSKRKKGSMTTDTNTVIEIETKLMNELSILKDPNVGKERKNKARTAVKRYEKFMNDIDYKHINGHKYPPRLKGFPDDVPMNVKEVLKLIESGFPEDEWRGRTITLTDEYQFERLDESGVSVGKDRFEYVDKGWSKPKEMKPVHLFK
jgi:hypothetical protein